MLQISLYVNISFICPDFLDFTTSVFFVTVTADYIGGGGIGAYG